MKRKDEIRFLVSKVQNQNRISGNAIKQLLIVWYTGSPAWKCTRGSHRNLSVSSA